MIVEKGHPAKKEQWALSVLQQCGSIGSHAYASGLTAYRVEADTLVMAVFMDALDQWRDATIMSAAVSLASDVSAATQARVYAVRHLTRLVNPYLLFLYGDLVRGTSSASEPSGEMTEISVGCQAVIGSVYPGSVGEPLLADYRSRIRMTLDAVAADARAPVPVRNAARCANYYIQ